MRRLPHLLLLAAPLLAGACAQPERAVAVAPSAADLPSWNESPARERLLDFVAATTTPGSPDFVPAAERIAVFDNDGTLWSEQPLYVQLQFALERLAELAPAHPEWQDDPVLAAALAGDLEGVAAGGAEGVLKIIGASHAGMTTGEFREIVVRWLETARHPQRDRPYTELVYQPMLELIDLLHAHDYQVWIVSGGGVDFMRPWTEEVYGIPPERVIGSRMVTRFEMRQTGPVLVREPELGFLDDKEGKPVAIHEQIGRRPVAAFGNSDGDLQMLQWTVAGEGARLALFVHHTDGEREVAYDRESHIGRLDQGLDQANAQGWVVVDMAQDWAQVFPAPR